jgi:hypothetical protein
VLPEIAAGCAPTFIVWVVMQLPAALLINVIIAVPVDTPVMSAPAADATAALLLVQLVPGDASDKSVTPPTHTLNVPAIGNGFAYTVLLAVA